MRTKLRKLNEGFTIVEVLIVLAIAALILTIVLIAVPDLQRDSRNTDIYHDAQNVASAIESYEGNNQGQVPASLNKPAAGSVVTVGASSSAQSTGHVQSSDTISGAAVASGGTVTVKYTTGGTNVTQGTIYVALNAYCSGGTSGDAQGGASGLKGDYSNRSVAVYYPIETSSSGDVGCIQE